MTQREQYINELEEKIKDKLYLSSEETKQYINSKSQTIESKRLQGYTIGELTEHLIMLAFIGA